MDKRGNTPNRILRNLKTFRAQQKKAPQDMDGDLKKKQYRQLEEILSPFWAWRMKT